MHKSENEKIDFILDEHERIFRKQGSLCMALGKGFFSYSYSLWCCHILCFWPVSEIPVPVRCLLLWGIQSYF